MAKDRPFEKVVDFISEVGAFFTVLLILFLYVNAMTGWITGDILDLLFRIREIAIVVVVILSGFELALKFKLICLIYILVAAAVVILMWFPEVANQILPGIAAIVA